jgi:adenylosuccinate synthase
VNNALKKDKPVLIEGTQGTFISLFYGDYPYVTSKDTTAGQVCADIGIGPTKVSDVILVFKSYVTRVGEGPLQDEISVQEAKQRGWHEVATVTGRARRAAPFDFELAKKAIQLNGATQLAITKLDILYPQITGLTNEDSLPKEALKFIAKIENNLGVPVTLLGTGPGVKDIITRRNI